GRLSRGAGDARARGAHLQGDRPGCRHSHRHGDVAPRARARDAAARDRETHAEGLVTDEPMVARDATYHRAPDALRRRVAASLAGESGAGRRSYAWRVAGIAIACAAAASITWNVAVVTLAPGETDRIAEQVLAAHVRSTMAPNHLMDVASADSHTVKPWFTG